MIMSTQRSDINRVTIGLILLLSGRSLLAENTWKDVPITGDPALFDLIRAAHGDVLGQIKSGSLEATITASSGDENSLLRQWWIDDKSYSELEFSVINGRNEQRKRRTTLLRCLINGDRHKFYRLNPPGIPGELKILSKAKLDDQDGVDYYYRFCDLRPHLCYTSRILGSPYVDFITPSPRFNTSLISKWRIAQEREHIVSERFDTPEGHLTAKVALNNFCMVEQTHYMLREQLVQSSKLSWAKSKGLPVPKEIVITVHQTDRRKGHTRTFRFDKYDINCTVDPEFFTEKHLRMAPGATIRDEINQSESVVPVRPTDEKDLQNALRKFREKAKPK